ncbi:uncharacterized protein LOC106645402 [Copidosoma floridanum]|uniref:uncharacterized protein LOC106645402 n=1 Tax=Copidosoma floridanum TaxID=29053 RepID=UPI0006C970C8|nr:uncharacterized protein LOC106645402 [Copidosoma floridanum]
MVFYQQHNAQINVRGNTTAVGNNNQHVPTSLNNAQTSALVSQNSLQHPQQSQQSQTIHAISMPISQADMYSSFNTGNSNASARLTKKIRTKAITDIVNPVTGRNISDEIYKDDSNIPGGDLLNSGGLHAMDCNAEVVADFAARVAKLASESPKTSPVMDIQDSTVSTITVPNTFDFPTSKTDFKMHKTTENNNSVPKKNENDSLKLYEGISCDKEALCTTAGSSKGSYEYLALNAAQRDLITPTGPSTSSQDIKPLKPEEKVLTGTQEIITTVDKNVELLSVDSTFCMKDEFSMIDCIVDKRVVTSHKQMNIVETNDNANSEPDDKNFVANVSKDEILLKSVEVGGLSKICIPLKYRYSRLDHELPLKKRIAIDSSKNKDNDYGGGNNDANGESKGEYLVLVGS